MESGGQMPAEAPYPLEFDVEYPDRDLNRLTTGLRIFAAIPILVIAALLEGPYGWGPGSQFASPQGSCSCPRSC